MTNNSVKHRWLALLLPVLAFTLITGCATNRPPDAQLDDAAITASVKSKFATDPDVSMLNIDVDTVNGIVTLTGMVDSATEKAKAGQLAAGTDGVRRVTNNLQIKT
jgi:hyperosmotically inducible protein